MELLYIWIDSYKNINRQGFNFSPKYRFDFVPTKNEKDEVTGGDLTCTENDFPDKFFGEGISNVTAIVGENGSGKSSVLEMLGIWNSNTNCEDSYKSFIIFYTNKNSHGIERIVIIDKQKIITQLHNYTRMRMPEPKAISSAQAFYLSNRIYYNNFVEDSLGKEPFYQWFDISSTYLKNNPNKNFSTNELQKQVTFLADKETYRFKVKFQLPDTLRADVTKTSIDDLQKGLKEFMSLPQLQEDNSHILNFVRLFILLFYINKEETEKIRFKEVLEKCDNDFILSYETFVNEKSLTSAGIKYIDGKKYVLNDIFSAFLTTLKEILRKHKPLYAFNFYLNIHNDISSIKDFIQVYDSFCKITGKYLFEFNWFFLSTPDNYSPLSSGEKVLLSLFARLISQLKEIKDQRNHNTENYCLLIDEGELGLHPQWQKEYLKNLIDVLPQIFKGKTIQIILTSHSPFLVSDLPKENIIFLEKDKETGKCIVKNSLNDMKQTFGANIHTLLTDSFFMHDKGLMGKFAEGKINDVILWLNDGSNKNIKELAEKQNPPKQEIEIVQWLIKQIGEPIIRNQLQKMLDSRRLAKVETHDEQIKNLESIVSTMQKHIEELKNKK